MKKFFINVQGGLGLNVGLASFISYLKNMDEYKDYKFYVSSPYYDIFEACEAVDGVYKPNELKDFIFDAKAVDGIIVNHRIYDISDFIYKKLNYSQAWAQLLDIEWEDDENGTKVKSILNPYKAYPNLKDMVDNLKNIIKDKGFEDYAIMQFTGGQSPLVQVPADEKGNPDWSKVPYDYANEPLKRHYPISKAQEFVNLYHEKHPNRAIILYQLPNEPAPQGDFIFIQTIPYLAYYELAKEAKEVVTIDSSLQHLVAGIVPTTVVWGHSKPNNFGYSYNTNIIQECRTDDLLYFTALGPSGAKIDYIEPKKLLAHIEE